MKIKVEFEVPFEKGHERSCRCLISRWGYEIWGYEDCKYHVFRDRMHGKKAPIERQIPKCTLFNEWLPGDYQKCEKCYQACQNEVKENENSKDDGGDKNADTSD